MPPLKRRRSAKSSTATATASVQDHGSAVALDPPGAIHLLAPPLLDDSPLEFEDFPDQWWSAAGDRGEAAQQFDPAAVDPLLHFPEEPLESHSTLQGICAGLTAQQGAAAVAAAAPPSKRGARSARSSAAAAAAAALQGVDQLTSKTISPRESHILSERQRRKGMNHLFSTLAALLPETSSKSDKSTIVSEIISYIQILRKDLDDLAQKRALVARSVAAIDLPVASNNESESGACDAAPDRSSVILNACGADVFITMASAKRKNLLSRAISVMEQHKLKILDANFSSNARMSFHYFHVKALNSQLPRDALERDLYSLTASETKIASSPSMSA